MRARVIKYGKYALLAVAGFVVFLFVWIQTGIGLPSLAGNIISGSGLIGEATLSIGSLRGNVFKSLTAKDISISHPTNAELLDIDRIYVEYSLFKLLSGTVYLKKTEIDAPTLQLRQNEESIWDITELIPEKAEETDQEENKQSSPIIIEEFSINQLNLTAACHNPLRDSIYQIQNVFVDLNDIELGSSTGLVVETFSGAITLPDRSDSVAVNIQGSLSNDILNLKELRLTSAESNVYGSGTLGLQWQDSLMNDTDFALRANPLSFDDVRIFAPGLAPGHTADLIAIAKGNEQSLDLTNALDISDGASIRTEGVFTRLQDETFQLSLDSEIKQLNPQTFNESSLPEGNLNLQVSASLSGSTLQDVSGYTQASMVESRLASSTIDTTFLTVQWTEGVADLALNAGIDDVDFSLSGFVFPFASPPTYNLGGTVQQFDLAPFTDSTYSSNLNIDLHVAGEDFAPEKAKIDARVDLQPSRVNQASITSGTIHSTIQHNRIFANARVDTEQGTLTAQTLLNLEAEDPLIESLFAEVSQLNVNPFLDNPAPSSISGTLVADARLSDTPQANWVLELRRTIYDSFGIQSANIEGSMKEGRIELLTKTVLDTGAVHINANLEPFGDQLSYEITEGSFSSISLASLLENPSLRSDLNGTLALKGQGSDLSKIEAKGTLQLSESTLNDQSISNAAVTFSLLENTLRSSLDVLMPSSEIRFDAQVDSVSSTPRLALERGQIRNLNLGSLLGDTTLTSSLNGRVVLRASGTSIDNLFLDAQLDVDPSTLNKASIGESQASVFYRNGNGRADAAFYVDEGSMLLQIDTLALGDLPRYALQMDIDNINLANLTGQDSLQSIINASLTGSGYGSKPEDMVLAGRLQSADSFYDKVQVDSMMVDFGLAEGLLDVKQMSLSSNIATLDGKGDVAIFDDMESIASDFNATGTLGDLRPLASLIQAEALSITSGDFEVTLSGPPGVLQFDSKLDIKGIIFNQYRVGVVDARVAGNLDENRQPRSVTLSGTADQLSIPGFALDEIIYSTTYADSTVRFSLDNQIDSDRNAQINGRVSLLSNDRFVELNTVSLKLDQDQWRLQQPAKISLGSSIVVDEFYLAVDGPPSLNTQFVKLDGIIDVEQTQDVRLHINNLNIGTLASMFGSPGLDGILNLRASLQGEAAAPQLNGDLNLSIVSFNETAGDLSMKVDYDSLRLNLDAALKHVSGDSLTIKGFLPVDLTLSPPDESTTGTGISQNLAREEAVNIDIQSDSLVIGWLLPFIDQSLVSRLDGALESDIKIRGTGENPELAGQGRFLNGVIHSPLVGVTFRDINSQLRLQDNVISFTNTSTRTGEGQFVVNGELRLQDLANAEIDIDMLANEFNVINTREYRSTLSGALNFTGTLTQPVLTGDIELLNTDVFIENAAGQDLANLNVQLSEEDLRMLENQFGVRPSARDTASSDTYEALTMDIDIELGRDTWIRSRSNPEMNVQFNGELDLTKRPYEDQEVFGSIEVNTERSYITQFGKRFEINQGTITFNGPATDPILDFEAFYEVPSRRSQDNAVTVYMDIDGTMETLDLSLRSDPTMELTDMVSYVVTGQPASEALQLGGLSNQSAESIAVSSGVGLLSNAIESLVQESGLELDVIQIEPLDNARGATITAGKYVTPRIFTAVSQPIGAADVDGSSMEQGTIVTLELELLDSLLLRLLGGESVMEINLLWHYAY